MKWIVPTSAAAGHRPDRGDGQPMRRALVVVAATLLHAGCADHTDFSGTYVGEGKGTYQPKGGATVDFGVPQDTISVKVTTRHYQYTEIEVTVRGCVVRSSGGETSWGIPVREGGQCTFDVPSVGPVEISLVGGVERRPRSRSERPEEVHLSLGGSGERVQMFSYTIDAKPAK
jgi:hypothetical protein